MTVIQELLRRNPFFREKPKSIVIHSPDGEKQEELETKCATLLQSECFDSFAFADFAAIMIELIGGNQNGLGEKSSKYLYDPKAQISIAFGEKREDEQVVHTLRVLHDNGEGYAQDQEEVVATDEYVDVKDKFAPPILELNIAHSLIFRHQPSYVLERPIYASSPCFRTKDIQACCKKVFGVYLQSKTSPQT